MLPPVLFADADRRRVNDRLADRAAEEGISGVGQKVEGHPAQFIAPHLGHGHA